MVQKSKIKRIAEGWKFLIFPTKENEELANKRADICDSCKYNILHVCSKCNCPLVAKVRSPDEECPEGKWKKEEIIK